jgi:hypothetical protein
LLAKSRQRPYNLSVLPVILAAVAATCFVHPTTLDEEVGRRAVPWLPPDLARQVVRHQREFAGGAKAAVDWPRSLHQPGGTPGLERTITAQCERLVAAIRSRTPFADVVAGLGALAHLASEMNAPFLTAAPSDPYAHSFAAYLPTAAPRIPLVFYGQQRSVIAGPVNSIPGMLAPRRREADLLGALVREDMDRVGGPGAWGRLDDRSSTFGTASLLLNHAATDFANLASWIWLHAGGLVPNIPRQPDTILVWKGEPQPREAPFPRLGLR